MIKQVTVWQDSDGNYHQNEREAKISDLMKELTKSLDVIKLFVSTSINRENYHRFKEYADKVYETRKELINLGIYE